MKNITLSLPDDLYEKVKAAAHEKQTSINAYVKARLAQDFEMSREEWLQKCYPMIKDFKVSYGKKVTREEMNERD